MSAECQELNHLFSQSVDGNRIKIPQHLESPPVATAPFILDILHDAAAEYVSRRNQKQDWTDYSCEVLQLLLSRGDLALSEFELIKLTHRWCIHNHCTLESFIGYFDFNKLDDEEKAWTLSQFPPSYDTVSKILNALSSSSLVTELELRPFQLGNPAIRWKCAFNSDQDRMSIFLETTARLLSDFHKKLIVLKVDDRLTLAIYVPRRIQKARDCCVDDIVRLFAFPKSYEGNALHGSVVPTKKTYRLYCDDQSLQLYQGQRRNTWVFIAKPGSDKSSYQNIQNQGDKRRKRQETVDTGVNQGFVLSVALDKFSKQLQTHVGRVNRHPIMAAVSIGILNILPATDEA